MTISELSRATRDRLTPTYGKNEAGWMTRAMMEHVFDRSRTDLIVDGDKEAADVRIDIIGKMTERILDGEPLQYILGYETFMGMRINVTPAVLIPRPETEELVEMIVDRNADRDDLRVLDAGTGSGCIALSLSRYLPFSRVTGIDISEEALDVARANAGRLKVKATWRQADILKLGEEPSPLYDIIVSNPPYVLESERPTIEANVLEHEPSKALFVPDSDPLRFYNALCGYARSALQPGGQIYFELNPLTAADLASRMKSEGWKDVEITPDSRRFKRFLSATLPPR